MEEMRFIRIQNHTACVEDWQGPSEAFVLFREAKREEDRSWTVTIE